MTSRSCLWPLLLALPLPATAQDFAAPIVTAPSGFGGDRDWAPPSAADLLDGWTFGLGTSLEYNSNVNPRDGDSGGDTIFSLMTSAAYRTQGTRFAVGARAALNHSTYFENSDLGGPGYNAGLDFRYDRAPLQVTGAFGYSFDQGVNRYFGSYIESHRFVTSLGATYRLSAKTSLDSRFSHNWTEQQSAFSDTQTTSFDIAALWQLSPLTSIGPGVSWSVSSGDRQIERQSYGPIVRVRYQLAEKVALDGTFGLDFVEYDGRSGTTTSFTTRLGANYQASPLWGMNLAVYRGGTAEGAVAGAFRESTSVRVGYQRRIRRATFQMGLGYETNETVRTDGASTGRGAGDYVTFDTSLGMAILRNRVLASTFYSWRDQSGGGLREADGYQIGIRLSTAF
jgi:hypothetical protein